jgi:ribonuclease Z
MGRNVPLRVWGPCCSIPELGTAASIHARIRTTYDSPLGLAEDFMVRNVTKDDIKVRMAVTEEHTWSPPFAAPAAPPGENDRAAFAEKKGLAVDAIGYSDFITGGKWNVEDVLRPIYQEASNAVGRELPCPEKQRQQ